MKDRIELLERVERRRVVRGKYFVESARLACLNKGSMSRGIEIRRWWILRGLMEDFFFFFLARLSWNFSRFYDRVVARCARCFHVVLIFRFD